MNLDKFFSIGMAFIVLAAITVTLTKPNSAKSITAIGNAWSQSLKVAMGG